MNRTKSILKTLFGNTVLGNMIKAALFYLLFILAFALVVNFFTNHGQSMQVPDVRGKSYNEVQQMETDGQLKFIIADSAYDDQKQPFTIIDQNPKPGSSVKKYRTIYLTVNSKTAPHIQMPDLKDISLKSASMILTSYGLKVGSLIYKPDLAKDAVLEQLYQGKPIAPGTNIKKSEKIDLVLGDGLGETLIDVPNLVGSTMREAKFVLDASSLNIGAVVVEKGFKGDTMDAIVYKQIPDPSDQNNNKMNAGEGVDVFLTSPERFNSEPKE